VEGGPAREERFPKALRLTRRTQFLEVQGRGAKVTVEPLLALVLRNQAGVTRLGLTVSSKVGNAVVRNRIRRRLRELFRKRRHELPQGLDLVLIARGSAAQADFRQLSRAYDALVVKLKRMFP
jgi:ribonuclease P protein component